MSLERRLTDALHRADAYQPSIDLFSRVSRSIEEDRAHRRRVVHTTVASFGLLVVLVGFLASVAEPDTGGSPAWPKWAIQLVLVVVLGAVLFAFGPAIRRLGQPFLADVFHMSPATGERFSRLLDIAYYLFFGGAILLSPDLTGGQLIVTLEDEAIYEAVWQMATFVGALGMAHAGNLLLLPMVGLVFSSLTRRARRRAAGIDAPPVSERARKTDRLVMVVVVSGSLLAIALALGLIGLLGRGG